MFRLFKRVNRQPVASVAVASITVPADVMDSPIPRVILDDYDAPCIPFTDAVTEQNVEEALAALIVEIGQPDYKKSASLDAIQTPMARVDLIIKAMNYMIDGCDSAFGKPKAVESQTCDDEEDNFDYGDNDEEEDPTYASVKKFLLERKNIVITPQEYLDANRFSFSV